MPFGTDDYNIPGFWDGGEADPSLGTQVRRPDGSFQHFAPGQTPHIFMGDSRSQDGGWAAAVEGSPEYRHYSSQSRRAGRQGAIMVASLVGGAAAAGAMMGGNAATTISRAATVSATNTAAGVSGVTSAGYGVGGVGGLGGTAAGSSIGAGLGLPGVAGGGLTALTAPAISLGGTAGSSIASGGASFLSRFGKIFGLAQGNSMSWIPLAQQGVQTLLGARGARRARQEREAGIAEARGVQEGALEQTMGLFENQRQAGDSALRRMLGMQGLPGGEEGFDITDDPSYQFRMNESMRALESGAAARGGLLSGGFSRQALRLAGDFASQEYSNIYNRLAGMVNLGMGAAGQQANALSGYSSNISNLITGRGEARAVGSAEKYNQLMDLAGATGDYFGGRGGATNGGRVLGGPGVTDAAGNRIPGT